MSLRTFCFFVVAVESASGLRQSGEEAHQAPRRLRPNKGITMKAIRIITTLVMTGGFGFFGIAKIVQASVVTDTHGWSRLGEGQWAMIGALEVAAVISLLLALHPRFRALGIAAATGLATLATCAAVYHIVNSDPAGDIAPAALQGAVAATYAVVGTRALRAAHERCTAQVAGV